MTRRACIVAVLLLMAAGVLSAGTRYEIDLARAASGSLDVRIEATCERAECDFQMPVWNATYQVRDFAQHVTGFQARRAGGEAISVGKPSPSLWRLAVKPGDQVTVTYRVRAGRPGPFGALASARHVCLNLAQVLSYPVDARYRSFTLRFANTPETWKTAIELEEREGVYTAESYDRLIDTPVHLSDFKETSFEHAGKRIRLVLYSPSEEHDLEALRREAEQIVSAATDLMGDVPFPSYTFVYHFTGDGGGGMEYRNGTSIYAPSKCQSCGVSELTAHEFFHLWNVKRIRPKSLDPVDFTQPNLTPSLWFSEGVTSTYSQFLRLRAGLLSHEKFLEHIARLIYEYESRPASQEQSAEESSIEAWLERYPDYGRSDRSVSYYLKGEMIGYLLDLTIRHHTSNQRSLDDVMRLLNREYGQQGKPFEDTDAIERAASVVAGAGVSAVFDDLVRSAAPIDWNRYLGFAGYRLQPHHQERLDVGLQLTNVLGVGVVVSAVEAGTPGEEAGFQVGDQILRVDGREVVSAAEASKRLAQAAGGQAGAAIERDGALQVLTIRPRTTRDTFYRMIEVEKASPLQLALRRGCLQRETDEPRERPPAGAFLRKKKAGRADEITRQP